jgi:chromate reductase, NAD(P)H dehydrogenase (quinone)
MSTLDIVGLCGSLRAQSFNHSALRLAGELMPASMKMEDAPWRDVPPFDADVQAQGIPEAVLRLSDRIRRADGVLLVVPEYNFSIPGMFKNMLDWVSRVENQPFAGKPVAILSATMGPVGGARMQYDLRRALLFLNASALQKPEVFIGQAQLKFDASGKCTDEPTRRFIAAQVSAFEEWIHACRRMRAASAT